MNAIANQHLQIMRVEQVTLLTEMQMTIVRLGKGASDDKLE